MFGKKIKCRCGKKVDANFSFCPYCGLNLKKKVEQDRARAKEIDDMTKQIEKAFNMPFFMKFPFEKLVKSMVKDIDKQFHEYDEMLARQARQQKQPDQSSRPGVITSGISINIKSGPEGQPIIQVKQFGPGAESGKELIESKERGQAQEGKIKLPKAITRISKAEAAKHAKLPRQEPETKVRRLTDKIIYEISLPGVKSKKNLAINKLQNSIEIKAFAKDKAYFKLIPLDFPIQNYKLENEKLILELKP